MSVKQEKLKKEQNEAMIFKVSLEMNGDYCERSTREIREALEAREPESRDECDFNVNAIFMEMKEICMGQEQCEDCDLNIMCARSIDTIKIEYVRMAMDAVKKRREQRKTENKSI